MNSGFLAKIAMLTAVLLLAALPAHAATITVGAGCTFIQAWNSAFDNDVVDGDGNTESTCTVGSSTETDTIEMTGNVTLAEAKFEGGGGTVIINGNGYTITGAGTHKFLAFWGSPTVTFNNITFTGGVSENGNGGAVDPYGGSGTYTFNDCVFHNNRVTLDSTGGNGGAINAGPNTTVNINRCAFYNNRAETGGAIKTSGVLTITNSSFYNNRAVREGGAITATHTDTSKRITLRHVTMVNNRGGTDSGALQFASASVGRLYNSILYGNTPRDCYVHGQEILAFPALAANSGSFIGVANCDFEQRNYGNQNNPQLAGPFNGYYIPRAGSPVINSSSCLGSTVPGYNEDQRGVARPIGTQCEAGAIEHAGYVPPPPPAPPGSDVGGPGGGSSASSRSGGSQAEGMPTAVAVIRYSPAQSCQTLQPDIVVSNASSGTSCSKVEGSEIGHPDVVAAMPSLVVDIWGWVTPGTQVCFLADSGAIKFIDTTAIPRTVTDLPVFSEPGGLLCATIDGAGQVALVAGPSAPAPQQQAASAQGRSLSDCMVLLQYSLNFRDAPDGEKIGALRSQIKLTALERTDGWFKVDYHGEQGWIAAAYVEPEGDCG